MIPKNMSYIEQPPTQHTKERGCEYLFIFHRQIKKSMHINPLWSVTHLHGLALNMCNELFNYYKVLTFDSV